MEQRLEQLRRDLDTGRAELDRLEQRRLQLHETLLRISGAVQVLEEVLGCGPENGGSAHSEGTSPVPTCT
jgi:hypothetical protein